MADAKVSDARISTGFPGHPKTKKLARKLGPSGPLGCIYLFLWAAANRSDGDLAGMSDEDIELAVDWAGQDGEFVRAMADVGFLDGAEGSRIIHAWADHNPWAAGAEARSEKARWAALCKQRGRKEAAKLMPEYAERMQDAEHDCANGVPPAVLDGAGSTPLAENGSPPSPSPSPSPLEQKQSADADSSTSSGAAVDADPAAGAEDDKAGADHGTGDLLGDQQQDKPPRKAMPPCPHNEIIALYHEKLPALRSVQSWTDTRAKHLQARWREDAERQSLDWWGRFFDYVAKSDFLMGRKNDFSADLEWLIAPRNFAKVIEGKYENGGRA
ncbi:MULTISPECIES: hypothetical protein [unclassified Xanthomonas]|uniref:hypothetical protein n=1 Tax=unclassified Xanthomonas TaxID=2643310 RepID=UPI002A82F150|nr:MULTISPECIES: hypothetical protein [unclassified Xanthomonas]MDY4297537.1 hypothetical protein [Xanthomonas sp. LF02-5]MDY4359331.1 hypothetical protein [Xanthomonas sp. LF04-12]